MKKQVYQSPCTEVSVIESSILCSSSVPMGGGTLQSINKQQGSMSMIDRDVIVLMLPKSCNFLMNVVFLDVLSLYERNVENILTSYEFDLLKNFCSRIIGCDRRDMVDLFLNQITDTNVKWIKDGKIFIGQEDSDLSNLMIAILPNGVKRIEGKVFQGCSSLMYIHIPRTVQYIDDYAFEGCIFARANFVNDSILDAEENYYWGATIVEKEIDGMLIDNNVVTLVRPNLSHSINIPDDVTSIGDFAFEDCSSLKSITIPNSVTSIGDYAFNGCSSLTSIAIPNSVTSIGDYAFNGCSSLTSIAIPNSVTNIGNSAFEDCSSLKSIVIPNSVTRVGDFAFEDCSSLKSITIPNSVTSIGDYAFNGCSSLTSIAIPNSVTSIGDSAFRGCSSLTSIAIPNSVTSIGGSAFEDTGIYRNESNWESSVLYIDEKLIDAKYTLSSVYAIKNGTRIIGDEAFIVCSALTSIIIPNSVTSIGKGIFSSCDRLVSIVVENGNVVFDSRNNCNAIIQTTTNKLILGCQNTTIPDSVTSIGDYAFNGCSSLISIAIPNSVTSIGDYAFNGCSSLTSIAIPNSVTSIGDSAFEDCSSLKSIVIPNSVTRVGDSAFSGCESLTCVTIGNGVKNIGENSFFVCENLTTIICQAMTPPDGIADAGCENTLIVYVPQTALETYQADADWGKYTIQVM